MTESIVSPPASETGLPARRAALEALLAVDGGAWSTVAVPDAVGSLPDVRDRRFASQLAYDTVRWHGTLDWLLGHVLTRPLEQVEPDLQHVLRLGALQLWRMGVPDRAAVSTSVPLARERVPSSRRGGAGGFVNGVLRALARQLPQVAWPDREQDPVAALALSTGHPAWVVRERLEALGPGEAEALLVADNEPPGVTLRASGDREALVGELRDLGLDASPTAGSPRGVRVPGADPRRLDAVARGAATPQDEASMLVVEAADVRPGEQILDVCSGPGGKATYLAQLTGAAGGVTAVELHEHRAELVRRAADRLGVDVEVRVGDARTLPLPADVDLALVDAPCTGLGTGRRRPEVRWRRAAADAAALQPLQVALAVRAAEQVRPGGRLVYAVCTWTTAETRDVVSAVSEHLGPRAAAPTTVQLGPHRHGTDGMFHATWHLR